MTPTTRLRTPVRADQRPDGAVCPRTSAPRTCPHPVQSAGYWAGDFDDANHRTGGALGAGGDGGGLRRQFSSISPLRTRAVGPRCRPRTMPAGRTRQPPTAPPRATPPLTPIPRRPTTRASTPRPRAMRASTPRARTTPAPTARPGATPSRRLVGVARPTPNVRADFASTGSAATPPAAGPAYRAYRRARSALACQSLPAARIRAQRVPTKGSPPADGTGPATEPGAARCTPPNRSARRRFAPATSGPRPRSVTAPEFA
jgi:hypothetical protein